MTGPFTFKLNEEQVNHYYIFYEITFEHISGPFQIIFIDNSKECGAHSNLNFVKFIWNYLGLFRLKMYANFAVHFDKPRILYIFFSIGFISYRNDQKV